MTKLKSKFILAFFSIALLVVLLGSWSVRQASDLRLQLNYLQTQSGSGLAALYEFKGLAAEIGAAASGSRALLDSADHPQRLSALQNLARLRELSRRLEALNERFGIASSAYPENAAFAGQVIAHAAATVLAAQELAGQLDHTARAGAAPEITALKKLNTAIAALSSHADQGVRALTQQIELQMSSIAASMAFSVKLHALQIAMTLIIALILASVLGEALSQPLAALAGAVTRVAGGDFSARVTPHTNDEIGRLGEAFNRMAEELNAKTVSKRYLDDILDSMLEALLVVDAHGTVVRANKAAAGLLDIPQHELCGSQFDDFVAHGAAAILFDDVKANGSFVGEFMLHAKGGAARPVLFSLSELKGDESGPDMQYVCVAKDMRAENERREQVRVYRERLTESERLAALGTMGGELAHRMNQPLTSMRLFLQQALREVRNGGKQEIIEESIADCLEEIGRASETVKNILRYTRKPPHAATEVVDLNIILSKTMNICRERAESKNVALIRPKSDSPLLVQGDEDELAELFFILMQNALDAAPEQKPAQCSIECSADQRGVEIKVRDTCGGIQPSDLGKIFDVFFSTKPAGQGTGLGLSIAKRIVEEHHGQISAESVPGRGTEFTLRFPKAPYE